MQTARSYAGMVVAPHSLAAGAGLAVLRQGGSAVQAAVATAAALCVVYPHMTGLGGDAFWLIQPGTAASARGNAHKAPAHAPPVFIDACGRSAALATPEWYAEQGLNELLVRGPLAAMTVAGAVSGWEMALSLPLPHGVDALRLTLNDIFADAIAYADQGFPVTGLQSSMTRSALADLEKIPGFGSAFLKDGKAPAAGQRMTLPALARTFRRLAVEGLDSFYRGSLARETADALKQAGSPLRYEDLAAHRAEIRHPLSIHLENGRLFNCPPPTQGVSSLMILGLMERYTRKYGGLTTDDKLVHAAVEATKLAFAERDKYLADPSHMNIPAAALLEKAFLDTLAGRMAPDAVLPWPKTHQPGGDTVWFGVADRWGNVVSAIQSVYHEFGSGLVLPQSGIAWQNRGLGFSLEPGSPNRLGPRKKPFHTLNPALALMDDGRSIAYGTMGGEGQPQTQAALFTRYAVLGKSPQHAVQAPRWLLGRAWGDPSDTLKLEASFAPEVFARLKELGHDVERLPALSPIVGQAGMIVRHEDGLMEAGFDPRSDGTAANW